MNKSDLTRNLASRLPEIPAPDIDHSVKRLFDLMSSTLAAGNRCEIRGFGTLSVHVRKARLARNPKTGESITVSEKRMPHFKPGKLLREQVMLSRDSTPIQE